MQLPMRHPQWEDRLRWVVAAWAGHDYAHRWGHDCVGFILLAIEAVSGERLTFGLRPYRSARGQARWLAALGWADLLDAADSCLGARIPPLAAHRGDIVSDGSILGVMTGGGPMAFGEAGLHRMAAETIIACWPVGRAD
ncbi:DUF6950 family protein [Sandarakinorhabdus sp.]|uniref:DUF6950 family protein n=1 Tax=Sandarakinorhabdus sp. TaxID=1916663 RepID=UPI00286E6FAE|nr:hypothetical protein [Sandarakinorhabdus sp.]